MAYENNRKVTAEEFWRDRIEAQRGSGVSIREFCYRHGLAVSTFSYWKRRIVRSDESRPESAVENDVVSSLVPVKVVGRFADKEAADSAIEVGLAGGRVLRVRRGFDAKTLVRVVEALEG